MSHPTINLHVSGRNMAYIMQTELDERIVGANVYLHAMKVYPGMPAPVTMNDQDREVFGRRVAVNKEQLVNVVRDALKGASK